MKKFFFAMLILCIGSVARAQTQFTVFTRPSTVKNVGFGKNANPTSLMPLVVNGPLVGADMLPVGGWWDNKKKQKNWVTPNPKVEDNFNQENGIFGLSISGNMVMKPYTDWINGDSVKLQWGFQNGRILVLKGYNIRNPEGSSKNVRSGIGFRQDNSLVVIISKDACTFYELAQEFVKNKCTNAIYLDGSSSYAGYKSLSGSQDLDHGCLKLQFFDPR